MQYERLTIDRIDLVQRALRLDAGVRIGPSRRRADGLHLTRRPSLTHRPAQGAGPALIDHNPEEPIAEVIRLLYPGEGLKASREGGLQRLVGGGVVAEHANGESRMDVTIATDEGRERRGLSFCGRGDEIAIGVGDHATRTGHAPLKVTG